MEEPSVCGKFHQLASHCHIVPAPAFSEKAQILSRAFLQNLWIFAYSVLNQGHSAMFKLFEISTQMGEKQYTDTKAKHTKDMFEVNKFEHGKLTP